MGWVWSAGGMIVTGEKRNNPEKNLSQCHFYHQKSNTDWPRSTLWTPWWEAGDKPAWTMAGTLKNESWPPLHINIQFEPRSKPSRLDYKNHSNAVGLWGNIAVPRPIKISEIHPMVRHRLVFVIKKLCSLWGRNWQ